MYRHIIYSIILEKGLGDCTCQITRPCKRDKELKRESGCRTSGWKDSRI